MNNKQLILFVATLSLAILLISLNVQTDNTKKEDRPLIEQTGEFVGTTIRETGNLVGKTAERAGELASKAVEKVTEPKSTLGLGFEDRTERERKNNKKHKTKEHAKNQREKEQSK